MKSEDTKRIIKEIADEEGISEWAVELIVKSQFEGVYETIRSAVTEDPETFKGIRLNAFCHFRIRPEVVERLIKRDKLKKMNDDSKK